MSAYDEQLDDEQRKADAKRDAKATKILGFNPFAIGKELEQWMKGCQWHGPQLKRKLKQAGFNLPLFVVHLEAMATRLSRSDLPPVTLPKNKKLVKRMAETKLNRKLYARYRQT